MNLNFENLKEGPTSLHLVEFNLIFENNKKDRYSPICTELVYW